MHKLTSEQEGAVDLFKLGDHLKIEALAGTGKTSTLVALAETTPTRKGRYLAFNDGIAADATKRFPASVVCSTTHSLAMRALRESMDFPEDKLLKSPNVPLIESLTGQIATEIPLDQKLNGTLVLSRRALAGLCSSTISNFTKTAAHEITAVHLPEKVSSYLISDSNRAAIFSQVAPLLHTLWNTMIDPRSPFPLGHDGYLKLWALRGTRIPTDYVLLDEAQDTTDVVLGVLAAQHIPVTYVGDSHQQIYDWRGAVNALKKITCRNSCSLTGSFRFGSSIAALAGKIVKGLGSLLMLRGLRLSDRITNEFQATSAVLCKTNKGVLEEIISASTKGKKVHVVGGVQDILRTFDDFERLAASRNSDHADLFGFKNLVEYNAFCSDFPEHAGTTGSLYRLWRGFREQGIRAVLGSCELQACDAQVAISTVHRAKGLEWDSVRLSSDFMPRSKQVFITEATRRVNYVAVTRASQLLCLPREVQEHIEF